jgi:DNA replication protein DnaC
MTAFLKIDECKHCNRSLPWEWVPAVLLGGKPLAGTSVWRSQLIDGQCPKCLVAADAERAREQHTQALRSQLIHLLGGEKPYREFTFERYDVTTGNQLAYDRCKQLDPASDNLYLWGPCGVGKTHLAWALARRCFEEALSVSILRPGHLVRRVRMKEPEKEQMAIEELVAADVLVLDDLGIGHETTYSRQILQEILDGRDHTDQAGLVVTSGHSLDNLAARLQDDAIPSRLAGLCQVIEIRGMDRRSGHRSEHPAST